MRLEQPLRRKLPILISTLLGVVVVVLTWFGYAQLEQAVVTAATERAGNGATQLAGVLHGSILRLRRDGQQLASRPEVLALLAAPTSAAKLSAARASAQAALRIDTLRQPQPVRRTLWSVQGTRVLDVGASDAPPEDPPSMLRPFGETRDDVPATWVSPLRQMNGDVYYDIAVPALTAGGDTVGMLVETRRLSSSPSAQLLGHLVGPDAVFLLGNASGGLWTDLSKVVDTPHHLTPRDSALTEAHVESGPITAVDTIPSSPWLVSIALSRHTVMAPARAFLLRAALVAIIVVAIAAFGAWFVSRSITQPLDEVARAAEGIAAGDYGRRASVQGSGEMGRLAASFNSMAAGVAEGQRAIRERIEMLTVLDVILASAPIGFALLDDNLCYVRVNEALARLNGRSIEEHLGKRVTDVQPELQTDDVAMMRNVLASRKALVDVELIRQGRRGATHERHLRASFFPVSVDVDVPPMGLGMFVLDTTESRALELQLHQAQRMEAVGQLAGGIAHDFNNLLTVITSYGAMVMSDLPAHAPYAGDVREMMAAAERAAGLTRQLLAFSRRQVLQPRVLDLHELTVNLEKMLRRLLPENIQLVARFPGGGAWVSADPGQLEQVIMNLVVNARDAMPQGGQLTIDTATIALEVDFSGTHAGVPAGRYVVLSVSDTGHGIDDATRARIFEPFFTTKPVGQGTGLGLSTVYGIVKQSGGYVGFSSDVGRGTTFRIYLPSVQATIPAPTAEPVPSRSHGSERILLVEDESSVRSIARRILERAGYSVVEAANGAEAVRVLEATTERIALVLTDLVMPEMGGRELADHLRTALPDARVLFMSGYTEDVILRQSLIEPGSLFLHKPFTIDSLTRKVRDALSAA